MLNVPFTMVGAAGKMGKTIIALSQSFSTANIKLQLCGALEGQQCPDLTKDAGSLAGVGNLGVTVTDDIQQALERAQVIIDFSSVDSTLQVVKQCRVMQIPCVIGTTGFTPKQREAILSATKDIPILLAANMSLGANLLFSLTQLAADVLGSNYDVEIIEAHHRFKKDAPSGTALSLRDAVKTSIHHKKDQEVYGRQGIIGERSDNEIGIHAVRGGDIVGDHTVFFLGDGEGVELTHRASSRSAFALGALRAASFLAVKGKEPALYSMKDVLNLSLGGR